MITNDYQMLWVTKVEQKETIYKFLKKNGFSENYCHNLRKKLGYIRLNNRDVYINAKIKAGDILQINKSPNTKSCIQNCIIPLDIVFENDDFIIINKPHDLATMPTKAHYSYNLAGAITYYMRNKDKNFVCRIVNRLDKDTSGIIVCAKNSLSCNYLAKPSSITKTYYALCMGKLDKPITIEGNILTKFNEQGINQQAREVCQDDGKPAKTYVTPIKQFNQYFLAKMTLEHGRTHQIRAHLASIGHALVGDKLYGKQTDFPEIANAMLICKSICINYLDGKTYNFEVDFSDQISKLMN